MNQNYVYWDIDTTDWNKVYNKYYPLFANLDINNAQDVRSSIKYFNQMTSGLIDSHYNITFYKPEIKDSLVFPANTRKIKSPNYYQPYSYSFIDFKYLDPGYVSSLDTGANAGQYVLCGTIKNKILYFYCNKFELYNAYYSVSPNHTKDALNYFFNFLVNIPPNIKGLIIDVRNNPGGDLKDLDFLMGRLIDQPLQFGYTRYKSDYEPLDYTPWINVVITPSLASKAVRIPVITLGDSYSASISEALIMSLHSLKNNLFVGETTWGATGPNTDENLYNDGPFDLPGFMHVTTSSCEFKYIDNKSYEGVGFTPDFYVPFNYSLVINGIDNQLEKAISLIN